MTMTINRFLCSLQVKVICVFACIMGLPDWNGISAISAEPKSTGSNLAVADSSSKPATFKETQDTFRQLSPQLHWLDVEDILFHPLESESVMHCFFMPEDRIVLKKIGSNRYSTVNLKLLLKDANAKVRTLAIVALCNKEDPFVLPDIAALSHDGQKTIQKPVRQKISYPTPDTRTEEQTVGQIVNTVIDTYMWKAGYYMGPPGAPHDFAKYWGQHKNRKYCASWFAIKLVRASASMLPKPDSPDQTILSIRKQLDAVPHPDRNWILLRLQSESGFNKLASESDVIVAMKELGSDKLLQMLQGKIPSDDPDLQPRIENYFNYQDMMISVLKRAKQVLRKDQANALLACGCDASTPWFAIAAAQLNPDPASKLLRDKLAVLDSDLVNKDVDGSEKADLAAALWRQCGLKEKTYLIDRFYNPNSFIVKRNGGNNPAGYREAWLSKIADNKKETQELIKDLINDDRFSTLNDYLALVSLTRAISLPDKVIWRYDGQWYSFNALWACLNLDEALRKDPDKTKHMLIVLAEWRKFLRDSVNQSRS